MIENREQKGHASMNPSLLVLKLSFSVSRNLNVFNNISCFSVLRQRILKSLPFFFSIKYTQKKGLLFPKKKFLCRRKKRVTNPSDLKKNIGICEVELSIGKTLLHLLGYFPQKKQKAGE